MSGTTPEPGMPDEPGIPNAVDRLFFGRDDAETDLTDGLLRQSFLRTYAYGAVLGGRKSLVIGRKGSGKSAICRMLNADGGYPGDTVLITPDDAAGDEIRRFALQGLTEDTAKSLIWRYVFAVHAARHLVRHSREAHSLPKVKSVRALWKFLQSNGETQDEHLYDRLRRGTSRLQTAELSLSAFGVEAVLGLGAESAATAGAASEGARALRQLEVLERGVAAAFEELGCAAQHPPLLFLVDQLENIWGTDQDSHALVTGLLLAAKYVTTKYSSDYNKAVRCALFLRADIYDTLNFVDGDRFRVDELRITWPRTDLRDLALARAGASLDGPLTRDQLWSGIFSGSVHGEPVDDYLFTRALARPRDVLQLLTACRDIAHEQGHQQVLETDVVNAVLRFSRWKLQDLIKEYLVNFPYLKALLALFENAGYVVMRQGLERRFAPYRDVLSQQFPAYNESFTLDGVISTLYAINFLGIRRGAEVAYAESAPAPLLPHEQEFHIHPCFRPALGALDAMGLPDYEPEAGRRLWDAQATFRATMMGYSDIGAPVRRDIRLRRQVVASCRRLLDLLARSPELPRDSRSDLCHRVALVLSDNSDEPDPPLSDASPDVNGEVVAAANYFSSLAMGLEENGFADLPVTRALRAESRALIQSVGGAIGGGSGSESGGGH